jgi:oligosaccharyltransferase complex subunit alpha (ribophorin I)
MRILSHKTTNASKMRLLQWATLGLLTLTTADSNLTHESRNILPSTFKPPQHFRNVNLVRNINLEKSYARETINVVIENVDKAPQSEYYLPFEQDTIGRVGGVEARDKKTPEKGGFQAEVVEIDPYGYGRACCALNYGTTHC